METKKLDLTADAQALIASARTATEPMTNYTSFDRAIASVEKTLSEEYGAAMHCRFELVCNTHGYCEVKLVCDF